MLMRPAAAAEREVVNARLRTLRCAGTLTVLTLALGTATATANHTTMFGSGVVAGGQPRNITAGPDGNLWFTYGHSSGRVARIGVDGSVTDLASAIPSGTGPYDAATGPDGNVWFTQFTAGKIGRLTPGGTYTEFPLSSGSGGPTGITAGPDGNMWFTLQASEGAIGRITPGGTVTRFTSGLGEYLQPTDITAGPDGNLWFTLRGNLLASPAIGRITTSGTITRFGLPYGGAAEQITAGPDGNLWFTLQAGNQIGRITPTGTITRFGSGLPSGSAPTGITAGSDGKVWFTLREADRIGTITTAGAIALRSSLGDDVEPNGITSGPDGNIWFVTRRAPAKVGRIAITPPTVGTGVAFGNGPGDQTLTFPVNTAGHTSAYTLQYGATTTYGAFASGEVPASATTQSLSIRLAGLTPGATYNYRLTVSNDAGSASGENGTFTAGVSDPGAPDPGPVAATPDGPSLGQAVVVAPVSGRVTVRPPGLAADVELSDLGGQLPVGTVVDTRNGRIELSSALPGGGVQTGEFWGGRFTVTQSRAGRGMTTLALPTAPLSGCPGGRLYAPPAELSPVAGVAATETARKKKKPRRIIWGKDDKGKFRTQGNDSVATVRGTKWATIQTCAGTITKVVEGAVSVRDLRAKRTVLVRAGRSYLARRPR